MSELIQERRPEDESNLMSFEEFMPLWTQEKLIHGNGHFDSSSHKLNYSDGSKCLIGEAHRFSDEYGRLSSKHYCGICDTFSYGNNPALLSPANVAKNGTIEQFIEFKQKVYNHFLDAHPEKLERK